MKKFIAYFDYLGFKEFIENNNLEYQKKIIENNFRDIESALGKGDYKDTHNGLIADLKNSNINCINFSDTVVFWTNDDSNSSLKEILEVSHAFNLRAINFCFPVRGSLVYGEIVNVDFKEHNSVGGLYNINSVFGKGLVKAYEKSEMQNWAGTVFDESLIKEMHKRNIEIDIFLKSFAKKYKVPYKNGIELSEEFVLSIVKGNLNNESLKILKNRIINNFRQFNKSVDNQNVQEKIKNTISFLESFCNPIK